jgi:ornithine--oxo-acid transaminase
MLRQASRLAVASRAFHSDQLGPYLEKLCRLTGQARALPMNSGAEAVETALKAARKWAYRVKGVAADAAEIIVCDGNFAGRTISIVSFSSEPQYMAGFGPRTPGFKSVTFGDAAALERAITPNTAAFLVEPIQGEGGIRIPRQGYLRAVREICSRHNVLMIVDEIQTGLGRTGKLLACNHENVVPDGLTLGKALGGGLLPVSAFLAREDVMAVFSPGDHGSTFGGNPLACAVASEALDLLQDEDLPGKAAVRGAQFIEGLRGMRCDIIREVRGRGLMIGVELECKPDEGRIWAERLLAAGLLTKETHGNVLRFAPPLVITEQEVVQALQAIASVFKAGMVSASHLADLSDMRAAARLLAEPGIR